MRKISIKIDNTEHSKVIKLDDFYLADDLSFVSGVCSPNVSVMQNGKCNVSIDSGITYQSANCITSVVKRMGYIVIDNKKHYVEDGIVVYNQKQYKATYIKNGSNTAFETAYCIIEGNQYDIQECQRNLWESVRKVEISDCDKIPLYINECECIGSQDCIIVDNASYDVVWDGSGKPYVIYNNLSVYAQPYEEEGVEYYVHHDLSDRWLEFNSPLLGLVGVYSLKSYDKACEVGSYLNLFVDKYKTEIATIKEKDIIKITYAKQTNLVDFAVEYTEDKKPYIDYYGTMYPISADMKICVWIDNGEYEISLSGASESDPTLLVGCVKDRPNALVSAQTNSDGLITDVYRRLLVEEGKDKYWSNEKVKFSSYSGITIGNIDYYVEQKWMYNYDIEEDSDLLPSAEYITLPNHLDLYCSVENVNIDGAMLQVYPLSINGVDYNRNYNEQFDRILGSIANNISSFGITLIRNMFGLHIDNVGEIYDYNKDTLKDTLLIKPIENGIKLCVPMEKYTALNLKNEWNINDLLNERLTANANSNTDVERDIYVPCFSDNEGMLHLLKSIKFNMHFRTRNLDDWSVIEDNAELNNDGMSSWNCLDNYYNTYDHNADGSVCYTNGDRETYANDLVKSGDLLYFLNFTDNDVFYQKSALSKSFLRLSLFDSPIPNQQNLLWTSTIFFDEGKCFMKYINNIEEKDFRSYKMKGERTTIGVRNENVNEKGNPTFNNDKRLCMEFSVGDKITSKTSSEGFYLYIYKEYANHLHPRKIYMRADFNHAKNGKSVPMMLLKHKNEDGTTYQANSIKDVFDMRDGVPMKEILNYIYMPIEVRYDTNLNKYTYRFEHLVEEETENLEINLFEVKYKDESK